jgi:hypothetical protein
MYTIVDASNSGHDKSCRSTVLAQTLAHSLFKDGFTVSLTREFVSLAARAGRILCS